MADIRELIILTPTALDPRPETPVVRRLADFRMMLRRAVVRSSRFAALQPLYRAFYDLHLWVAARIGRWFPGTRAIYLSSGLSSGPPTLGVSDVDLAIYGDWEESKQFRLMKFFGLLTVLSPLFDRMTLSSIGTVEDLRVLCATNYQMALTHAKGARQWRLLYGEPVLAEFAEIAPERFSPCAYMEIRRWWNSLSLMALGGDVVARDTIFRNSISFKAAAETLRAECMLETGDLVGTSRRTLIERELERTGDPTLRLLLDSSSQQYLAIERDPRDPTLHWFLAHAERFHEKLERTPAFLMTKPIEVTGDPAEASVLPQTRAHAERLVETARSVWPQLRAAFLAPSLSMFYPDNLSLLFDVEDEAPSLEQLRAVCDQHRAGYSQLGQRLSLYLVMKHGAYQLDSRSALEFFYFTYFPAANPDVYSSMTQRGYTLHGEPRTPSERLGWSVFAAELIREELQARRGAYSRFGVASLASPLENMRNFWRYLQLLAVDGARNAAVVTLPLTLPAIRRSIAALQSACSEDLAALETAFAAAHQGNSDASAINAAIQRVYDAVPYPRAVVA